MKIILAKSNHLNSNLFFDCIELGCITAQNIKNTISMRFASPASIWIKNVNICHSCCILQLCCNYLLFLNLILLLFYASLWMFHEVFSDFWTAGAAIETNCINHSLTSVDKWWNKPLLLSLLSSRLKSSLILAWLTADAWIPRTQPKIIMLHKWCKRTLNRIIGCNFS